MTNQRATHLLWLGLALLGASQGCAKSDGAATGDPSPALRAQAVQWSLAAARAAHEGRPGHVMGALPAPAAMAAAPLDAPAAVSPAAPLPAFAGGAHLYHLGAKEFFLDAGLPGLTGDQSAKLALLKARSALDQAEAERQQAQAEEQLWMLTGADQPDATRIEAKVREIETLRGDQRLAFIRAVGAAAALLTGAQREHLVAAQAAMSPSPAMTGNTNPDAGGMESR